MPLQVMSELWICLQVKAIRKNSMDMMKSDISKVEHLENMLCAFEKSNCIDKEQGCVCPDCQVHKEYDLQEVYYCLTTGGQ
jgi:hypothetical protein